VLGSCCFVLFWSCCSFLLLQAVNLAAEEGVLDARASGAVVRGGGAAAGGRRRAYPWCAEGQSWSGVCAVGQVREADGSAERGEGRR
jgi:hypothetical protein